MNTKTKDKFINDFCNYIQWRGDRGADTSLKNLGWQLEQASWLADVVLGLFLVLIKKKVLDKTDLKEIFWHGEKE